MARCLPRPLLDPSWTATTLKIIFVDRILYFPFLSFLPDNIYAPLITSVSLAASTTIASSPFESIESVGKKVVDWVSFLFSQAISTPWERRRRKRKKVVLVFWLFYVSTVRLPVSSSSFSSSSVVDGITRSVMVGKESSNRGGGLTRSSGRQTSASRRVGAVHWQRPNKFGIRKSQCEFTSHNRQWACS